MKTYQDIGAGRGKRKTFSHPILSIFGGIIIGVLATLLLKLMGGRFF
jgi:hypothetical protein